MKSRTSTSSVQVPPSNPSQASCIVLPRSLRASHRCRGTRLQRRVDARGTFPTVHRIVWGSSIPRRGGRHVRAGQLPKNSPLVTFVGRPADDISRVLPLLRRPPRWPQPKVRETNGLYGGGRVAGKMTTSLPALLLARDPLLLQGVPIKRSFRALWESGGASAAGWKVSRETSASIKKTPPTTAAPPSHQSSNSAARSST